MRAILFLMLFYTCLLCAQTGDNGGLGLPFPQSDYLEIGGLDAFTAREVYNKRINTKIDGSPYLYASWSNISKIVYADRTYKLNEVNYNIYAERFEAKTGKDSVLILSTQNIEHVFINDKVFGRYLDPEFQRNSYFEEVADVDNKKLLKKYTWKIQEGTINSLNKVKMTNDRLVQGESYYVSENGDLKKIKLKKSTVLNWVGKEHLTDLDKFVKERQLNYKNIDDVKTMFQYYNSL